MLTRPTVLAPGLRPPVSRVRDSGRLLWKPPHLQVLQWRRKPMNPGTCEDQGWAEERTSDLMPCLHRPSSPAPGACGLCGTREAREEKENSSSTEDPRRAPRNSGPNTTRTLSCPLQDHWSWQRWWRWGRLDSAASLRRGVRSRATCMWWQGEALQVPSPVLPMPGLEDASRAGGTGAPASLLKGLPTDWI